MASSESTLAEKPRELPIMADSEAETERLHISPVKRRVSDTGRSSKRARPTPETDGTVDVHEEAEDGATVVEAVEDSVRETPESLKNTKIIKDSDEIGKSEKIGYLPPTSNGNGKARMNGHNGASRRTRTRTGRTRTSYAEELEANARPDSAEHDEDEDEDAGNEASDEAEAEADAEEEGDDVEAEKAERMRAIQSLSEIEVALAAVRDRIHDQQLARCDLEIRMCQSGSHPELEALYIGINHHNKDRLARTLHRLEYEKRSISQQTRATRTHILQQYTAGMFKLRQDMLVRVPRLWYQVNRERRTAERRASEPSPAQPPTRSRNDGSEIPHYPGPTHQALIASGLEGLGIPSAPQVPSASEHEALDDLRQMGLRP